MIIRHYIMQNWMRGIWKKDQPFDGLIKSAAELAIVARSFEITNVAKYTRQVYRQSLGTMLDMGQVILKLPYKAIIMEYHHPAMSDNRKYGILFGYGDDSKTTVGAFIAMQTPLAKQSKGLPEVLPVGCLRFEVDPKTGIANPEMTYRIPEHWRMNEQMRETALSICIDGMTPALFALGLLNCKNVRTVVRSNHDGRTKAQRKAIFKEEYHVLNVPLINRVASGEIKIGEKGEPGTMPLHTVRGHVKTYTAEKPLLGKHVGQWWWDPMVRGSGKNGIIEKDYSVAMPEQAVQ